jgi:hypothetical protein
MPFGGTHLRNTIQNLFFIDEKKAPEKTLGQALLENVPLLPPSPAKLNDDDQTEVPSSAVWRGESNDFVDRPGSKSQDPKNVKVGYDSAALDRLPDIPGVKKRAANKGGAWNPTVTIRDVRLIDLPMNLEGPSSLVGEPASHTTHNMTRTS